MVWFVKDIMVAESSIQALNDWWVRGLGGMAQEFKKEDACSQGSWIHPLNSNSMEKWVALFHLAWKKKKNICSKWDKLFQVNIIIKEGYVIFLNENL